jgi:uncharacterized protein (DUF1501 family)
VVVELAGGNDGFNTLVPHADPQYRALRPTLAVTDPIDLDGQVGFHPQLAKLAARYTRGEVAVVEGVGFPEPDLSHFAALDHWWAADPTGTGTTGWLGRYLDTVVGGDDPLAGVVVGPRPSPALVGTRSFSTTIPDVTGLAPRLPWWFGPADDLLAAWADEAPRRADGDTRLGEVQGALRRTDRARRSLDRVLGQETAGTAATSPSGAAVPAGGVDIRDGLAVEAFDVAARLAVAPDPPRVIYLTDLGDYDTHQGQEQRHAALLADLDAGIEAFSAAVEAAGRSDRVLVMTVSEFGRRAAENGSGTDHGTANTHLLVGAAVRGGRAGVPVSFAKLDSRGNVAATVDVRALYATVLQDWLGVEAEPILGGRIERLPVVRE